LRGGGTGYALDMDKIEHEVERVAEGRDEFTPFKALAGVWVVVAVFAGLVIAAALIIWAVLR
jgi:hypothetical protein